MAQMAEKRLKGFDCGKVIVFVKWEGRWIGPDVKYKVGMDSGDNGRVCIISH